MLPISRATMNQFMSHLVCEGFSSCTTEILSWKCWNAKKKKKKKMMTSHFSTLYRHRNVSLKGPSLLLMKDEGWSEKSKIQTNVLQHRLPFISTSSTYCKKVWFPPRFPCEIWCTARTRASRAFAILTASTVPATLPAWCRCRRRLLAVGVISTGCLLVGARKTWAWNATWEVITTALSVACWGGSYLNQRVPAPGLGNVFSLLLVEQLEWNMKRICC